MKITDMHFKTITVTDERHGAIQKAIIAKGGYRHGHLLDGYPALFLSPGGKITTGTMLDYIESSAPEVPYEKAMADIAESRPVTDEKWKIFKIDENGDFRLENPGRVYKWWDWARALSDSENKADHFIFGGWSWRNDKDKVFTTVPLGENISGTSTDDAHHWINPRIPTAIRFWVGGKG